MTTTMRPITELIRDPIPQTATEAFWLTGWQVAQATTDTQVRGILRGWEYADVIPPHQIRRLLLTLPTEVADLVFPYWESVATTYADISPEPVTPWDEAVASFWAGYGYARSSRS